MNYRDHVDPNETYARFTRPDRSFRGHVINGSDGKSKKKIERTAYDLAQLMAEKFSVPGQVDQAEPLTARELSVEDFARIQYRIGNRTVFLVALSSQRPINARFRQLIAVPKQHPVKLDPIWGNRVDDAAYLVDHKGKKLDTRTSMDVPAYRALASFTLSQGAPIDYTTWEHRAYKNQYDFVAHQSGNSYSAEEKAAELTKLAEEYAHVIASPDVGTLTRLTSPEYRRIHAAFNFGGELYARNVEGAVMLGGHPTNADPYTHIFRPSINLAEL